jgi:hypothetical protein
MPMLGNLLNWLGRIGEGAEEQFRHPKPPPPWWTIWLIQGIFLIGAVGFYLGVCWVIKTHAPRWWYPGWISAIQIAIVLLVSVAPILMPFWIDFDVESPWSEERPRWALWLVLSLSFIWVSLELLKQTWY